MSQVARNTFAAVLFGLLLPSLSAASGYAKPAAPLGCAESVALSVTIADATFTPDETPEGDSFGEWILARMVRRLGEARIAIDPRGRPLHLDILPAIEGKYLLIALSSRDSAPPPDAEWLEVEGHSLLSRILPETIGAKTLEEAALGVLDQAIGTQAGSGCEPTRTYSANRSYALEIPPRDRQARERYLTKRRDALGSLDPEKDWPFGSLIAFDGDADGDKQVLTTFPLVDLDWPERFLVADDGRFVVACGIGAGHLMTIYRGDGSLVARLAPEDLLDLREIDARQAFDGLFNPLSATLDEARDHLVLSPLVGLEPREIAIDLNTGRTATPGS